MGTPMKFLMPVLPLLIGALLDSLLGDPYWLPHPVRLTGRMIAILEKFVRRHFRKLLPGGGLLTVVMMLLSVGMSGGLLLLGYWLHPAVGVITEGVLCYYLLAARCLYRESDKVRKALVSGDTEAARQAVSMIVGRDTAHLDEAAIARAAVETVAENTSDGVTAPLFYMMLGGAVGGCLYKTVNTMDSMLGYKSETYREIGCIPAKTDDLFNYVPSRLTALLMIAAAGICGLDSRNAMRIWRRDRRRHASPNSAQTEAVCAGALHLRLAGDAWYFGELHKKPYIGDPDRPIEPEDIRRADRLMYVTAFLMLVLCCGVRAGLGGWLL